MMLMSYGTLQKNFAKLHECVVSIREQFANIREQFANIREQFANVFCTLLRDKFSTPCMNKILHNTAWQTYMLHDCCEVLLVGEPVAFVHTYVRTLRIFNKPAKWQLGVITHTAICPISNFTPLNIQCTYSENSTLIGLLLLG